MQLYDEPSRFCGLRVSYSFQLHRMTPSAKASFCVAKKVFCIEWKFITGSILRYLLVLLPPLVWMSWFSIRVSSVSSFLNFTFGDKRSARYNQVSFRRFLQSLLKIIGSCQEGPSLRNVTGNDTIQKRRSRFVRWSHCLCETLREIDVSKIWHRHNITLA